MAIHNETALNGIMSDVVLDNGLVTDAPSIIARKKRKQRETNNTRSTSGARTAKQIAADERKEDRRRKAELKQIEKEEKRWEAETQQNETDDRFTSSALIRAIKVSFGRISFDPCWHKASVVEPEAYLDVRRGDNGLRDAWAGNLVFVNPPWSAADKWLRRAYDQWSRGNACTVVCLVPAKTDTRFFHSTLVTEADLYFMAGRPIFSKEDGTSEGRRSRRCLSSSALRISRSGDFLKLLKERGGQCASALRVRSRKPLANLQKRAVVVACFLVPVAMVSGGSLFAIHPSRWGNARA